MFEGIPSTIFESQVALHAAEMPAQGVTFEIWCLEGRPSRYPRSLSNLPRAAELANSRVRLFRGMCIHYPASDIVNALILLYHWRRLRPNVDFIHARADWTAASCGLVARWLRVPILWDCRGHAEAEFAHSYRPTSRLARLAKSGYLHVIRWRTRFAARSCSGANFVSALLRERCGQGIEGKPVTVIPCPVSSHLFSFSPHVRQETRRRLGYGKEDRVMLYSGGMAKHQGFPAYIDVFKAFRRQDIRTKFLILSPELSSGSAILADLEPGSYQVHSAAISEMNAYYNAADFGLLLREDNAVNQVASPTKFGEYCLTGLPVIMNSAVRQASELARKFGNLRSIGIRADELLPCTDADRMSISLRAKAELSRDALAPRYRDLYLKLCDNDTELLKVSQ